MYTLTKFKSLICIILSSIMLFSSASLHASVAEPSTPPLDAHTQTIYQFIDEIREAQRQSTVIAQAALKTPPDETAQLQLQLNSLSSHLQRVNKQLEDYADTVQGLNAQDSHVRLTFSILNLVRSNLYTLGLLLQAATSVEKVQLYNEYFRTHITALDLLVILERVVRTYT